MDVTESREFLKKTGIAFFGSVGHKALNYLFLLVATRVLSASAFGAYVFLIAIANFAQRFGMLGVNNCIDYYVPQFLDEESTSAARSILITATGIVVLVGLSLAIGIGSVASVIASQVDHPSSYAGVVLLALSVPVYMYLVTLRSAFHAVKQIPTRVVVHNLLFPGSQVVFLLGFTALGFGLLGALGSFGAAVGLSACVATVLFLRSNAWTLSREFEIFDPKKIAAYSLPLTASVITSAIIAQVDFILLGVLRSTVEVGYYRLAYSVAMLPTIVPPILRSILKPIVAETQDDPSEIGRLYEQATRWMVLSIVPISVTLLADPAAVIRILFGENYGGGSVTPALLIVGQMVVMALGTHNTFLQGLGDTRPIFLSELAALVINVVLDLLLIPELGMIGAAIGAATGTVTGATFRAAYLYQTRGINPMTSPYLRALLPVPPVYAIGSVLGMDSGLLGLGTVAIVVTMLYYLLSVVAGAITEEDIVFVEVVERWLGIEIPLVKRIIRRRSPR